MSTLPSDKRRHAVLGTLASLAVNSTALLPALMAVSPVHAQPKRSTAPTLPRRVAVAGGAVTEIVYALNTQALLVGVDTTSTYPPATRSLPKIGYQRALSAEGVLSLHPDLLLVTAEAGPPTALMQIMQAGVKVITLGTHHDVKVVRDRIRGTAAALGLPSRGERLLQRFDAEWEMALASVRRHRQASNKPPRVMFILSHSGTQAMVAGRDTAADAMIRYAGAINALGGADDQGGYRGYKPLTAESTILASPDVLLTTSEGLDAIGGIAKLIATPGIALTPAAKKRRVVGDMDALLLLGFGPRLPAALTALSAKLFS
ncbi:heme/hemin ABC transporter substrate-binding protein [Glaciimonas immobilis]|uniref:Iron complex transport system substrate-binding protein n=1 Tax=Glaciimonas immobilis TaxID=728004 RepID=A0A840RT62_9BURK|nr:ABC transporter substrate-binding protein [Glaciimonas immobilis]KAF3996953.1 ABC transporter substrate-binding protein [Glaciimonas immobilis]MBB5199781.1 iron complex transport system substrate-binding protein [Glaciimonas immobilis]